MSELHKFLFDGMPVRGAFVRLGPDWQTVVSRRAQTQPYPGAVVRTLGEMTAASLLLQANIKFNGAVVLQIMGDGPVQLAVVEVQPDFHFRATAKVQGELAPDASLGQQINVHHKGRCAITLDPKDRLPGQQPYQGVVALSDAQGRSFDSVSEVLSHYMLQSEHLDTTLVLYADEQMACGLLIQRLPATGEANLSGQSAVSHEADAMGENEDYNRIAMLARSLKPEEMQTLAVDVLLHRLFWQEPLMHLAPDAVRQPTFACTCSRERVANMLVSLGPDEVAAAIAEVGQVEVDCDFCGARYVFDPVDAAQLFVNTGLKPPASQAAQ